MYRDVISSAHSDLVQGRASNRVRHDKQLTKVEPVIEQEAIIIKVRLRVFGSILLGWLSHTASI